MAYQDLTIKDFAEELGSAAPVPGGGSVAALAGALGVTLFQMVAEITMTKKKPEDKTRIAAALAALAPLRARLLALMDEDAASFAKVMAAYKLPKDDADQQAARQRAVEAATVGAAEVPLATAREAVAALAAGAVLAEEGAASAISDVACGALCLEAAVRAAAYNVRINLGGLPEGVSKSRLAAELAAVEEGLASRAEVRAAAERRLG